MKPILRRRHCLMAVLVIGAMVTHVHDASAEPVQQATVFIRDTGDRLAGILNGAGGAGDKRRGITQILDAAVDVDGIARFCLGRFWRAASADQQQRYTAAFHAVLVNSVSAKLGEYRGVRLTVQRARKQDDQVFVATSVERPNNPPTTVEWVVELSSGAPKIVDMVTEGTSLRLTQRQDYASYLSRNNSNVDALITAMRQQTERSG